jgi:succinate dehydrogenase/fumarate reductase flavoprotein subunit
MTANSQTREVDCDLLVIGSGAAGLSAAVTAAWHGLKVTVVEKDPVFGGATAWSGGWMWGSAKPARAARRDHRRPRTAPNLSAARTRRSLRRDQGHALLEAGPHMVSFFERHTALKFVDGNWIPDVHGNVPGAGTRGHQVIAAPYDGRQIGKLIHKLRPPPRETCFLGMGIMSGPDLYAFLHAARSLKAFVYVARRVSRHLLDLVL